VAFQIRIKKDGLWHRRHVGNGDDLTACDEPIPVIYGSRDWVLDDNLCPVCFTPRERDTGKMKKIEKEALEKARADDLAEEWHGSEEITDEIEPPPLPGLPKPPRDDDASG
jgi:hypothetical protein